MGGGRRAVKGSLCQPSPASAHRGRPLHDLLRLLYHPGVIHYRQPIPWIRNGRGDHVLSLYDVPISRNVPVDRDLDILPAVKPNAEGGLIVDEDDAGAVGVGMNRLTMA